MRVMVMGRPPTGTFRSVKASENLPTWVVLLTTNVEVAVDVWPNWSVKIRRRLDTHLSKTVGSMVELGCEKNGTGAWNDVPRVNQAGVGDPSWALYCRVIEPT